MRIAVYFPNATLNHLDYSKPEIGNPGMSGTLFEIALLISLYPRMFPDVEFYQFSEIDSLIDSCPFIVVQNRIDAALTAQKLCIDLLLINTTNSSEFLNAIKTYKVRTVFWGQNYYFADLCDAITSNEYIVHNVFCSKQFYDRYIDHDLIKKSSYIFNIVIPSKNKIKPQFDEPIEITYIGSIIPSKGLHLLTRSWSYILKRFPHAKLNIIGSAKLYDSTTQLGRYSLAEPEYETKLIRHLVKADKSLNSVRIHGVLSESELTEVLKKTWIGVPNPSARTETFCVSSTDFQKNGIPVVVKAKNGMLDTMIPNTTGLTFNYNFQLKLKIVELLKTKQKIKRFSDNGPIFISSTFDSSSIINKWNSLFVALNQGNKPSYIKPANYYNNNLKYMRIIFRCLRFDLKINFLPSVIVLETLIYKLINSFIK
jgi:glycosyltransferase involved in cell wall biosynthesis